MIYRCLLLSCLLLLFILLFLPVPCHYFTNYIFVWTSQSRSGAWSVSVPGQLAKFVNKHINK